MNRSAIFEKRRQRVPKERPWQKKLGCYARQFLWDEDNGYFYLKTIPDLAFSADELNAKYFLWTTPEEERDRDDPAAVIQSMTHNRVSGRVFEPDNPADFVFSDGKRYVNVRETYYVADDNRRQRKAAA